MINQKEIVLKPKVRGFHIVTSEIISQLDLPKIGVLHLFLQHTSAGLTINENADPSVLIDFETVFNKLIPENDPDYIHIYEGADDMPAHIKSSFTGVSLSIPISNYRVNLGTWQGIYLCEYRNYGGSRKLIATIYS